MATYTEIASYDTSLLIRLIRMLRLTRHYRLVIHAPVEECIAHLKPLEKRSADFYYYSILLETNHYPYRFLLIHKWQNHEDGYMLGEILKQTDTTYTEINFELLPPTTIITITPLALFLSMAFVVSGLLILPLGNPPAWCYIAYFPFAVFHTVGWIAATIMARNYALEDFKKRYLKTLPVNYQLTQLSGKNT
jgi:hypothetical protein